MSEKPVMCGQPTGGVSRDPDPEQGQVQETPKEVKMAPLARVGREAPDFVAPAYQKGKFIDIKLSDYRGKWTLVCFYPGDFTFV